MTHYLRDEDGENLIEAECYNGDVSTAVYVANYSATIVEKTINCDSKEKEQELYDFIGWMENMSEIRGLWFENHIDSGAYKDIENMVGSLFKTMARKHDLQYVTD